MSELPEGWTNVPLSKVTKLSKEKWEPSDGGDHKYLSLEHIESGTGEILGYGKASEVKSSKSTFDAGDVLYGKLRPYLNKTTHPDFPGICSTDILVYKPKDVLESSFLQRLLSSPDVVEYANRHSKGINLPRVSATALGRYPVSLPPAAEQRRIVARLETLQTHSLRAKDALERIPDLLDLYRQSVLAAAFRGDLTRAWREAHPDVEPASEMLERIRAERRQRWIENKAQYYCDRAEERAAKKGKTWDKAERQEKLDAYRRKYEKKYTPPEPADSETLRDLPAGWCWARAEELFSYVTSGSRGWSKYYDSEGALFVRVGNLSHSTTDIDLEDVQLVNLPEKVEGHRSLLQPNDLLISITADVGMIGLVPPDIPEAYINQHIALARPTMPSTARFIAYYLSSLSGGKRQFHEKQYGATKKGLNLSDIADVVVPLPPLDEQRIITHQIRLANEYVASVTEALRTASDRLDVLDSACLSKAFRGELVPTEAELARREGRDYESAEALLARIAARRNGKEPSTLRADEQLSLDV